MNLNLHIVISNAVRNLHAERRARFLPLVEMTVIFECDPSPKLIRKNSISGRAQYYHNDVVQQNSQYVVKNEPHRYLIPTSDEVRKLSTSNDIFNSLLKWKWNKFQSY